MKIFKIKDKTFCNFATKSFAYMKTVLKLTLFLSLGLIGYGYYLNSSATGSGEKFIGVGVLVFAFVLMPLFIYHRYKNKDLKNYSFKDFANPPDKKTED